MSGSGVTSLVSCAGICVVAVFLLVFLSFARILPVEAGIKYDYFTSTASPAPYVEPGLWYVGPVSTLMRYPTTIQNVIHDESAGTALSGRTKEGLKVSLSVSWQYMLIPEELFQLYNNFETTYGEYEIIYRLIATNIILGQATTYTARQLFTEKAQISVEIQQVLDDYFSEYLHARVRGFQINEEVFETAYATNIVTAAVQKQKILRFIKLNKTNLVQCETQLLIAKNDAKQISKQAIGQASQIEQRGMYSAYSLEVYIGNETQAYERIKSNLSLSNSDVLNYMFYDSLAGGAIGSVGNSTSTVATDTALYFGVDPQTFVNVQQPSW